MSGTLAGALVGAVAILAVYGVALTLVALADYAAEELRWVLLIGICLAALIGALIGG